MPSDTAARFKTWFWRPPRPHGEVLRERSVSNLELLYDLVYVAVIGQASHALAAHLDARGIVEFAVVFGMIWTAWVNGSLYIELHGRQDGRTRLFVFVQMAILTLLAVFTADAAGDAGGAVRADVRRLPRGDRLALAVRPAPGPAGIPADHRRVPAAHGGVDRRGRRERVPAARSAPRRCGAPTSAGGSWP